MFTVWNGFLFNLKLVNKIRGAETVKEKQQVQRNSYDALSQHERQAYSFTIPLSLQHRASVSFDLVFSTDSALFILSRPQQVISKLHEASFEALWDVQLQKRLCTYKDTAKA